MQGVISAETSSHEFAFCYEKEGVDKQGSTTKLPRPVSVG